MRRVKLSLSLPALLACSLWLCGCNTLANRRSLYAPKKGEGYWTRSLQEGKWKQRGTKPADTTVKKGRYENPTPSGPIIPPPPPEPLPESAGGAAQPHP